ncbi:hypothetical protein [Candidatus Lokiarchaeum ossiferum]|uniref:hypothetical protein n=1 Tax=Candidatus Lokiarchaeum ossiferum TaxID=2951803 RepID=UPI00352D3258
MTITFTREIQNICHTIVKSLKIFIKIYTTSNSFERLQTGFNISYLFVGQIIFGVPSMIHVILNLWDVNANTYSFQDADANGNNDQKQNLKELNS